MDVVVDTWLPLAGRLQGMILNHSEALSLSELFSSDDAGAPRSPTVCFVYHPCEQTMLSLRNLSEATRDRLDLVLLEERIVDGRDELGVLAMTERFGSFWLGSRLDIHTARRINACSSATSLQVAGAVIAGMCWVIEHRDQGFVEPEDIGDHDDLMDVAEEYWGGYWYERTDWRPAGATGRDALQFESFRRSR